MTLHQAETDIETSVFIVVSPAFRSNRTGPVLATWDILLDKRDCEERETEEKREVPDKWVRAWLLERDTLAQSASVPGLVSVMLDIQVAWEYALSALLNNTPSSVLAKGEGFVSP
jgi:hypothetical protein